MGKGRDVDITGKRDRSNAPNGIENGNCFNWQGLDVCKHERARFFE